MEVKLCYIYEHCTTFCYRLVTNAEGCVWVCGGEGNEGVVG